MSESDPPTLPKETVMMTVKLEASKVSAASAAAQLGVPVETLDQAFGVVPIDPDRGLYAVKVPRDAAPAASTTGTFRGPFSNPRISPFGLRKKI